LSPAKPLQRILGLEIIIQDSTKNAVLGLLPSLVIVQRNTGRMFPWLPSGQEFLLQEEHSTLPGYEVTARHLATLIFTSLVRAHITVEGTADANWLRGLSDPKVGKALTIMHSKFKEPWTIQTLANACGMSRTNFMRKFVTLVGTTPMAHLNSIRMSEAAQQLDTGAPAGQVATNIGYKSDCAFRRAFSLRYGCTPSQYTKNHKEN
jgi:AraC-like DNA-binding protein